MIQARPIFDRLTALADPTGAGFFCCSTATS
jgi:hypothetical protein